MDLDHVAQPWRISHPLLSHELEEIAYFCSAHVGFLDYVVSIVCHSTS